MHVIVFGAACRHSPGIIPIDILFRSMIGNRVAHYQNLFVGFFTAVIKNVAALPGLLLSRNRIFFNAHNKLLNLRTN